jgi:hypothetical protein
VRRSQWYAVSGTVRIKARNSGFAASFDSDALQVSGVPLSRIDVSGERVMTVGNSESCPASDCGAQGSMETDLKQWYGIETGFPPSIEWR